VGDDRPGARRLPRGALLLLAVAGGRVREAQPAAPGVAPARGVARGRVDPAEDVDDLVARGRVAHRREDPVVVRLAAAHDQHAVVGRALEEAAQEGLAHRLRHVGAVVAAVGDGEHRGRAGLGDGQGGQGQGEQRGQERGGAHASSGRPRGARIAPEPPAGGASPCGGSAPFRTRESAEATRTSAERGPGSLATPNYAESAERTDRGCDERPQSTHPARRGRRGHPARDRGPVPRRRLRRRRPEERGGGARRAPPRHDAGPDPARPAHARDGRVGVPPRAEARPRARLHPRRGDLGRRQPEGGGDRRRRLRGQAVHGRAAAHDGRRGPPQPRGRARPRGDRAGRPARVAGPPRRQRRARHQQPAGLRHGQPRVRRGRAAPPGLRGPGRSPGRPRARRRGGAAGGRPRAPRRARPDDVLAPRPRPPRVDRPARAARDGLRRGRRRGARARSARARARPRAARRGRQPRASATCS
jgi:hypothetical protein